MLTLSNTVRPPLVTYPSLCSTCVTYRTSCHTIRDLQDIMPYHWSPAPSHPSLLPPVLQIWESIFLLSGFFYFILLPAFFNLKISRASCWSLKHSPSPTICLNHSNPQKFYTGRFYSRARAGQSRNINLCGELVLPNVSFEMFASHPIWTLLTDR